MLRARSIAAQRICTCAFANTTTNHTISVPSRGMLNGAFSQSDGGSGRNTSFNPVTSNLPINWGVRIVPQQQAWVVERFGKFHRILEPGLQLMVPLVDRISYVHSLKEVHAPFSSIFLKSPCQSSDYCHAIANLFGTTFLSRTSP